MFKISRNVIHEIVDSIIPPLTIFFLMKYMLVLQLRVNNHDHFQQREVSNIIYISENFY